ncbi:MAG: hypothetical protein ACWA47_13205 [Brevirhabdus sp.]
MSITITRKFHPISPLRVLFLVAFALLATGSARAQGADTARVKTLFDLIGLSALVEDTRASMQEIAEQTDFPKGPVADRWKEAAGRHFDPTWLRQKFVQDTAARMTADEVEELISLFSTDFALRVSGLETAQQTGFDSAERTEEGRKILARLWRQNPDRAESYNTLLEVMNSVEDALVQMQKVTFILIRSLALEGVAGQSLDDKDILAMLASRAPQMRQNILSGQLARAAHTYDALDDEEFDAYVALLELPLVQGMYDKVGDASQGVMLDEFEAFAETLARMARAEEL